MASGMCLRSSEWESQNDSAETKSQVNKFFYALKRFSVFQGGVKNSAEVDNKTRVD